MSASSWWGVCRLRSGGNSWTRTQIHRRFTEGKINTMTKMKTKTKKFCWTKKEKSKTKQNNTNINRYVSGKLKLKLKRYYNVCVGNYLCLYVSISESSPTKKFNQQTYTYVCMYESRRCVCSGARVVRRYSLNRVILFFYLFLPLCALEKEHNLVYICICTYVCALGYKWIIAAHCAWNQKLLSSEQAAPTAVGKQRRSAQRSPLCRCVCE